MEREQNQNSLNIVKNDRLSKSETRNLSMWVMVDVKGKVRAPTGKTINRKEMGQGLQHGRAFEI